MWTLSVLVALSVPVALSVRVATARDRFSGSAFLPSAAPSFHCEVVTGCGRHARWQVHLTEPNAVLKRVGRGVRVPAAADPGYHRGQIPVRLSSVPSMKSAICESVMLTLQHTAVSRLTYMCFPRCVRSTQS